MTDRLLVQEQASNEQVNFRLALDLIQDVARGLKSYLSKARDLTISRGLDQNLAIALTLAKDVELAQFMRVAQTNTELQGKLQLFRESLSDPRDWQTFEQWWSDYGETWVEQLQAAIAAYKKLDYEVQLTDEQKKQFQQYYEANKLLIDCIASGTVSDSVKQEIEETLILPIGDG